MALPQRKYRGPDTRTRINKAIRAAELRVVGPEGENLGTLSLADALKKAEALVEKLEAEVTALKAATEPDDKKSGGGDDKGGGASK